MIDTLIGMLPQAANAEVPNLPSRFALVTLHRPSNVDDLGWLRKIISALYSVSSELEIIFPVHPRTRQHISQLGLQISDNGLKLLEPLPYLSFLALQQRATVVITDSRGIQEETTYLGIPCLTLRENTERPVTVEKGTNTLVGRDPEKPKEQVKHLLNGRIKRSEVPPLWDGKASQRVADVLMRRN